MCFEKWLAYPLKLKHNIECRIYYIEPMILHDSWATPRNCPLLRPRNLTLISFWLQVFGQIRQHVALQNTSMFMSWIWFILSMHSSSTVLKSSSIWIIQSSPIKPHSIFCFENYYIHNKFMLNVLHDYVKNWFIKFY